MRLMRVCSLFPQVQNNSPSQLQQSRRHGPEDSHYTLHSSHVQTERPVESQICTLCSVRLQSYWQVQSHLMSRQHLDMVVRNPELSVQDFIVPEQSVASTKSGPETSEVQQFETGYYQV